ncbi:MAG: transposase [Methylovulum sp.]|nr:MAG: transposase [Methylovulum sp.]
MSVSKRKFTRDFKIQVVQEVEQGFKTRAQINREYELSEGLVAKWIAAYKKDPQNAFTGVNTGGNSEVDKLKAKISQLEWALGRKTMEVELLRETVEKLRASGVVKRG